MWYTTCRVRKFLGSRENNQLNTEQRNSVELHNKCYMVYRNEFRKNLRKSEERPQQLQTVAAASYSEQMRSDIKTECISHDSGHALFAAGITQVVRFFPAPAGCLFDLFAGPDHGSAARAADKRERLSPYCPRLIVFDQFNCIGRTYFGACSASDADTARIAVGC